MEHCSRQWDGGCICQSGLFYKRFPSENQGILQEPANVGRQTGILDVPQLWWTHTDINLDSVGKAAAALAQREHLESIWQPSPQMQLGLAAGHPTVARGQIPTLARPIRDLPSVSTQASVMVWGQWGKESRVKFLTAGIVTVVLRVQVVKTFIFDYLLSAMHIAKEEMGCCKLVTITELTQLNMLSRGKRSECEALCCCGRRVCCSLNSMCLQLFYCYFRSRSTIITSVGLYVKVQIKTNDRKKQLDPVGT